ncbi:MAG: rod shape-determining protein MreD [Gammaproteobacteria bacterium]|nr:rod shape-determining protein MreD [Gammaproteobacteria bacterium]
MKEQKPRGRNIILVSFIAAFILTMMPLPELLQSIRPEFVTIVLIYWCMALPARVGVGIGWIAGLVLDVLTDSLLGQHALTLALIAYLAIKLHQRIRVFPLWQQALTIFVLMSFQATIVLWIRGMLGQAPSLLMFMLPAISTAIFWPVGFLLMRQVRRYYQVN